jgi:hypothetical protein
VGVGERLRTLGGPSPDGRDGTGRDGLQVGDEAI